MLVGPSGLFVYFVSGLCVSLKLDSGYISAFAIEKRKTLSPGAYLQGKAHSKIRHQNTKFPL